MTPTVNDKWASEEQIPAVEITRDARLPVEIPMPIIQKLSELVRPAEGDGSELLKNRFLCRGG